MNKVVKLTKANTEAVDAVVKDAKNELLKAGKVVNLSIARGLPFVRRKFVKTEAKAA
jgi:hypothetical protein